MNGTALKCPETNAADSWPIKQQQPRTSGYHDGRTLARIRTQENQLRWTGV